MKLAKKVRKYQTVVLGGIVAIMAISLIFSFSAWPWREKEDSGSAIAGTFKDETAKTIVVTKQEYFTTRQKSEALIRYERILCLLRFYGIGLPYEAIPYSIWYYGWKFSDDVPEEEINKRTWDNTILLYITNLYNITVDEPILINHLNFTYQILCYKEYLSRTGQVPRGQFPYSKEHYERLLQEYLHTTAETFESAVKDHLCIEKFLKLILESEFAPYSEVSKEFLDSNKKLKIRYTSFESKDFQKDIKPSSENAIHKYFNDNKKQFEMHKEIQLDYLFADFDTFKSKVIDPPEEETKKYYNENQQFYEVKDGSQVRYKTFDEVRSEIKERIKLKKSEEMAYNIMKQINVEIGNLLKTIPKEGKLNFSDIAKKFDIKYGITPYFSDENINEIEKVIGNDSDIEDFSFRAHLNEITKGIKKTIKGCIIYRLIGQKELYVPNCITEDIREKVIKALKKEQIRQLARKKSLDIVSSVQQIGFEKTVRKYNVDFNIFGYFDKRGHIEKQECAGDKTILPNELVEKAFTLNIGNACNVDIGDESYVVFVEDIKKPSLQDFENQFEKMRNWQIGKKRHEAIKTSIDYYVKFVAQLDDKMKPEKKGEEKK